MSSILKKVIQGIKERHKSELGKLSDKLIREKSRLKKKTLINKSFTNKIRLDETQ